MGTVNFRSAVQQYLLETNSFTLYVLSNDVFNNLGIYYELLQTFLDRRNVLKELLFISIPHCLPSCEMPKHRHRSLLTLIYNPCIYILPYTVS